MNQKEKNDNLWDIRENPSTSNVILTNMDYLNQIFSEKVYDSIKYN